jgi:hypothetical protein
MCVALSSESYGIMRWAIFMPAIRIYRVYADCGLLVLYIDSGLESGF